MKFMMKKNFLTVMMMCAVVFLGCEKEQEKTITVASEKLPKICLVSEKLGIDDKSFNAATWQGILDFYGDTWENPSKRGTYYDYVLCQSSNEFVSALKNASKKGYDLIILNGYSFAAALSEVASLYPDQKYMIADVDTVNLPNVMECVFAEEQGSFLVGVAAAMQAKTEGVQNPKFGFIGGVPGVVITKFEMGYIQGLRSVIPNAEIVDYYAHDWGNPGLAKAKSKEWFDNGVYAIFSAAGGTGNGTIEQAKEYRMQGKNVWAIGVDSDQYYDGIYEGRKSAVLTSMVKRVENSTRYALKAIQTGTFKGGVVRLRLEDNGMSASITNPDLGTEILTGLKKATSAIISGEIQVESTYAGALAKGLVPNNLGAKDKDE